MPSRVIFFELPTVNSATSRKFYETVFGWEFAQYGDAQMDYWLVRTGAQETPGIDGAVGGPANQFKSAINTVGVDNLDEAIQKVQANGGKVVAPKMEISNMGWVAYIREPGGAILGMFQEAPGSGM